MGTKERWIVRKDIAKIMEAERGTSHPWKSSDILNLLRRENVFGLIGEKDQKCVAYAIYSVGDKSVEIIRFVYLAGGESAATGILDRIKDKMAGAGKTELVIYVRETCLDFLNFLKKNDFLAIKVLKNVYGDDDAYYMKYGHA